jgi:hypothetical protein
MPKKTKREKIIAEYRRALQNGRIPSTPLNAINNTPKTRNDSKPYQFSAPVIIPPKPQPIQTDESEFKVIRKDLMRKMVIAGVAIASEFIIYLKFGIK